MPLIACIIKVDVNFIFSNVKSQSGIIFESPFSHTKFYLLCHSILHCNIFTATNIDTIIISCLNYCDDLFLSLSLSFYLSLQY
jgi:hypothetical protein